MAVDDRERLPGRVAFERLIVSYIPASQTKADDLIDRLMAMDTPSDFSLRGLERDAEAVMDVDPAAAHSVLGGVASLRWDANGVREHFRIARQHADNYVTDHNYSIALAMVDEWWESFAAPDAAQNRARDNTVVLGNAIERAVEAGRFRMAHEYCDRLNALRPNESPHAATGLLERFVASLDAGAFGESNVQRVLEIAGALQHGEGVRGAKAATQLDQDEPDSFLFRRFIGAAPATAAKLNSKLADEIGADDDLMQDPGLRFIPLFVGVGD